MRTDRQSTRCESSYLGAERGCAQLRRSVIERNRAGRSSCRACCGRSESDAVTVIGRIERAGEGERSEIRNGQVRDDTIVVRCAQCGGVVIQINEREVGAKTCVADRGRGLEIRGHEDMVWLLSRTVLDIAIAVGRSGSRSQVF